jgi:glycosyltransferase involved in cell wall biosynthesis
VLTLGRLVRRKGIDTVIEAIARIPGTELVVAGGPDRSRLGDDPEVSRLRRTVAECGVTGRVSFTGRVAHEDVPDLLSSADVVVSDPWYEPFGIVPVEAMACGIPVVAAAVGGLADTVIDNVTGLHVPPRDPGMIAAALRRLLADPEQRRALGAAGRARAVRRYAMDRVITGTLRAYAASRHSVTTTPEMRA